MKKFKTKKKAHLKKGLTSGQKLDPADLERAEISVWLNQCLENLKIQIEQFEAEIETLSRTKNAEKLEELNGHVEKHRDHVHKLKTLLRVLDNDKVDINQIKDIKEDVEYYIDHCQDPEFMENDMIYEDIDGLEEMLLDVSHVSFMITATLK
jgi:CCR4-NOT transcription complex subunit 3